MENEAAESFLRGKMHKSTEICPEICPGSPESLRRTRWLLLRHRSDVVGVHRRQSVSPPHIGLPKAMKIGAAIRVLLRNEGLQASR